MGELEVRGPWVTARYVGDDDAPDEEKFRDGWLRTGDVGTLSPDGYITLTDRAKDVIKSGGEWISSVELENALMAPPGGAGGVRGGGARTSDGTNDRWPPWWSGRALR